MSRRHTLITGAAVAACAAAASGSFVGLSFVWTPVTINGVNYLRWTIAATFDGPTDTVLAVRDLVAVGGASSHSYHTDSLAAEGGATVPTSVAGTWNPRSPTAGVELAVADSFVTIGGALGAANTTQPDPAWTFGGNADVRGWDRADLPDNGALGWFNAQPANLQGRVGNSPGLAANQVRLMEITRLCGTGLPVLSMTVVFSSGVPGAAPQSANASLPLGGVPPAWFRDLDGDGFGAASSGVVYALCAGAGYVASPSDCDDHDAALNPMTRWYLDLDGDGVGLEADGVTIQCLPPAGYALADGDNCPKLANPDQRDCDGDALGDLCEIAADPTIDINENMSLDSCERIWGDLDLDGAVGAGDLALLLGAWGTAVPRLGDLDGDGLVGGADLAILLGRWGTTP